VGSDAPSTLTAKDGAGNTIDSFDATLNTITYNFAPLDDTFDAPNGSQTVANNDTPNGSTLTFVSGAATVNWKFFATGTVPTPFTYMTDVTNSIGSIVNSNTIDVISIAGVNMLIRNPINAITSVGRNVNVDVVDIYHNRDVNYAGGKTFRFSVDGSATAAGGPTYSFTSGRSTIFVNDLVRETVIMTIIDDQGGDVLPPVGTENIIFTGPANKWAFGTNPVAGQTINQDFITQPVVEIQDDTLLSISQLAKIYDPCLIILLHYSWKKRCTLKTRGFFTVRNHA